MKRLLTVAVLLAFSGCRAPERRGLVVFDSRTYAPLDVTELGPCVTVDMAADRNGALANLRGYLSNEVLHGTVQGAISNLNSCSEVTTQPLTIAGHGLEGTIITGGGHLIYTGKHISHDNVAQWDGHVRGLTRGPGRLTILSCSTGGGAGGALLLSRLANRTGRVVRARTGLSYFDTDKVYFEDGTVWNEVAPETEARNIARPRPRYAPFQQPSVLTLGGMTFPVGQIDSLRLDFQLGESVSYTPGDDERADLLTMIDFAHPFTPPGEPLAPETARILIRTRSGATRTILIYGNVLARDEIDRSRYFDVDLPLTGRFMTWAR